MNKKNKRILIRIAMVLVCAAFSFLLIFGIYKTAAPEVFYNDEQRAEARLRALVGGQEIAPVTDQELLEGVSELYGTPDGAYIVQTTTRGFLSDVTLRVGIAADGSVSGLSTVSHGETPELGGMALQKDYLDTYIGAASSEGIEAYSGASFTSEAIRAAVDLAVNQYKVCNGIEIEVPVEVPEEAVEEEPAAETPAEEAVVEAAGESSGAKYEVSGKGLMGDVVLAVTVAPDGTVADIEVISSNETPGIGSIALEEAYLSKYIGASSSEGIDGCTGASFTTSAIRECIDKALEQFKAKK